MDNNQNQNVFGNNDLKPVQEFDYDAFKEHEDQQNTVRKKHSSTFSLVGKTILYFLLLPLITSWVYIHLHWMQGEDNYFTRDIPFIAKVLAVLMWVIIGITSAYMRMTSY